MTFVVQALMREHMRNTDRAVSNIESHPEGFNALRRMYENVQVRRSCAAPDTCGYRSAMRAAEELVYHSSVMIVSMYTYRTLRGLRRAGKADGLSI